MKILYGIQGTGHGHISRAREILPMLTELADVDVLLSGYNCNMNIDGIPVSKKRGISLAYDANGSVSYLKTALNLKPATFLRDVHTLDLKKYNLVISDYEPVTAWAALNKRIPSLALSHQAAFLSKKSPRPKQKSQFAEQILKNFAPCNRAIGFHFQRYDTFIEPPIIRSEVMHSEPDRNNHITVYLPAYHHETLMRIFRQIPQTQWHLFSPHCDEKFEEDNVVINPVGNLPFLESLKTGLGVVTSSGFETCAEAMFLGKKLLTIPIRNQYEQLCNAAALEKMGIQVIKQLDDSSIEAITNWLSSAPVISLNDAADAGMLTQKIVRYARRLKKTALGKKSGVVV